MRRQEKVTAAESPTARIRRAQALLDWCDRHELDGEHQRLLGKVLDGRRGLRLAAALSCVPQKLAALEASFRERTGLSVYEAAIEVVAHTRQRTSTMRPPPSEEASATFDLRPVGVPRARS